MRSGRLSRSFGDDEHDLYIRGVTAAQAGDEEQAKFYLNWAMRKGLAGEKRLQAIFWLSQVCRDPGEKRQYLEETLRMAPNFTEARRALAILNGELRAEDIINPEQLTERETTPSEQEMVTFSCPQCGGRLEYTADGQQLACQSCRQPLPLGPDPSAPAETGENFGDLLVTARGHLRPMARRDCICPACGAQYSLLPQDLSLSCPYCATVTVINEAETRELLPPDEMIPFGVDQDAVRKALDAELARRKMLGKLQVKNLNGLYFPVWRLISAFNQSNMVPATNQYPEAWLEELDHFDLSQVIKFDPAFLANWPAETNQISAVDAHVRRRHKGLNFLVSRASLVLVPLWIAELKHGQNGKTYRALINGQTGRVCLRLEWDQLRQWLAAWFKPLRGIQHKRE